MFVFIPYVTALLRKIISVVTEGDEIGMAPGTY